VLNLINRATATNKPAHLWDEPRRTRDEVLKLLPGRQIVDFLINHFLHEVNWIYETIHPPTFLERYSSWWLQPNYFGEEDIQFAVLILRLCACSLQFLPNSRYETENMFDISSDSLISSCHMTACKLDTFLPKPKSLLRLQQQFFHIHYLKNSSNIGECWNVLRDTISIAQDISLHKEVREASEFDMEMRRRVFWNLYVWDRFMSSILGRWQLIPESQCKIDLPHDSIPNNGFGGPNPFAERILEIKLSRMMGDFHAEWAKNPPGDLDVAEYNRRFQEDFIQKLPPVFRLYDPDVSFDSSLPSLVLKRETIRISVFAMIGIIHRESIRGPESLPELRRHSQSILIEACISLLGAVARLHGLMGGGPHRFFMLPMATIESAAAIGTCLITQDLNNMISSNLRQRAYIAFCDAVLFLDLLSSQSLVAKKGLAILQQLQGKMQIQSIYHSTIKGGKYEEETESADSDLIPTFLSSPQSEVSCGRVDVPSAEPDWSSIGLSSNMTWFFDDEMFVGL
jgi:hypothetical protein